MRSDERGLTLSELIIVMALASLVMTGLTAFYFSSQATWVDGSTQALAQRDGTLLLREITSSVHAASSMTTDAIPDSLHNTLTLFNSGDTQTTQYRWNSTDSLIHKWTGASPVDRGPVVSSKVRRFQVNVSIDKKFANIRMIELLTANRERITLSAGASVFNGK
jgi:prepilin-type N-terminal cleavage/methylation domain-containing protein